MIIKKLYIQIIIRVLLILANTFLVAYFFFMEKFIVTQINLIILLVGQSILLVYYLNKTNRNLANFFSSVTNQDSTIIFEKDENNSSFESLYEQLNNVNHIIKNANIQKIGHYEYLKHVVENVGIGILSFDEDLKVQFFNPAGKDILRISNLKSIPELDKIHTGLAQRIKNLTPNQQHLIHLKNNSFDLELSVKLVEFTISNKQIKLLAFQDIQSDLNKREVESWQKVIRVLTHEIMNSVSPISSATTSINGLLKKDDSTLTPGEITEEIVYKTIKGLNIIQQRSEGMLEFVKKFRDLTLLPEPQKENIKISELYNVIETLFKKEFEIYNIDYNLISSPEHLTLNADKSQMEQVLINLVKNSIESVKENPNAKISINSFKNNLNKIEILVNDNGKGIKKEIIDNIFTPFFTTKENLSEGKAGGSGIGLSLSQQIMYLHGGNISVKSEPNKLTTFQLIFQPN